MKKNILLLSFCLALPIVTNAQESQGGDWASVDGAHQNVQETLNDTANTMNDWFGESKTKQPAKAKLRIMFDNRWDKYDGYSIKPRIRGSLKLPTLQERVNLVFGDESVDNELHSASDITTQTPTNSQDKHFDADQSRRENSTIGLQWLVPNESDDISTKLSIGLRSNGDIYGKAKAAKNWYHANNIKSRAEIIYRYGSKSEHFARSNFELSHQVKDRPILKDQIRLEYKNKDDSENWSWGNTLSHRHPIGDDEWFNYGIYTGGDIANGEFTLNTYGPFAGLRTRFYREWLFLQPEITYYNDKNADEDHHIGVMVRLEAQF